MPLDHDVAVDLFTRDQGALRFGYPGNREALVADTDGNLTITGELTVASLAQNVRATKTATEANATTTPDDVDDLALSLAVATYDFRFYIPYQQSVTGNGVDLRLKSSGAPTSSFLAYSIAVQSTDTTRTQFQKTAFDDPVQTVSVTTANKSYLMEIFGRIIVTAAGILQPQFAIGTGTGGTVTLQPSWASATPL